MMPGREHTMNNKRHKHGGDIYSEACTLDYSANINPLGPPSSVIEAVYRSMEQIVNYPDVQCRKLCHAIAEHEYVKEEQVICTNGASELLYAFAAALKPKKALLLEPGFAEYEAALSAVGCEIFYYPLGEEKGYALDLAYLEALSDDLDMIILCNPNNPTGVLIQQPLLVRIAEKCEKYGIHFLLDECFHEFLMAPDSYSMRTFLERFPHLFLVDAFTKIYAIPGLRLGYGLSADADLMEKIRDVIQPWSVSIPAQEAGIAALSEDTYVHNTRWLIREERKYLARALHLLEMETFDSQANYLFFKGPEDLEEQCQKRGLLIRDCSNYRGLSGGYYRIAVRRREENERLLAALVQVTGSSVVENGKEDKKPAAVPDGIEYVMPQEIEKRSFSIIEEELQLRGITLPVEEAMVTKRVIHTSADFSYAQTMTYSTGAVETAKWLITEGADIVTDTNMALSGINKRVLARYGGSVHCFMADEDVAREAKERGVTRATVSMERAAKIEKPVIFAIGNAPTALIQLYGMIEEGYRPAFIIGVPVGFVNVEAAKELILQTKIPHIVNRGRKGGSNVAAAICNAILYELGR